MESHRRPFRHPNVRKIVVFNALTGGRAPAYRQRRYLQSEEDRERHWEKIGGMRVSDTSLLVRDLPLYGQGVDVFLMEE